MRKPFARQGTIVTQMATVCVTVLGLPYAEPQCRSSSTLFYSAVVPKTIPSCMLADKQLEPGLIVHLPACKRDPAAA